MKRRELKENRRKDYLRSVTEDERQKVLFNQIEAVKKNIEALEKILKGSAEEGEES